MLTESSPLNRVAGPAAAKQLAKNKGLHTVGDLLDFAPRRYLQPNTLTDLGALQDGDDVVVVARVETASVRYSRQGKPILNVTLTDGRNEIDLAFFSVRGHAQKLVHGASGFFSGKVGTFGKRRQMAHPEYELTYGDETSLAAYQSHQIPVYSTTGKITSMKVRAMVASVLDSIDAIPEFLPADVVARRRLPARAAAYELIHRPSVDDKPSVGLERLKYDEAFVLQTILGQRRALAAQQPGTARVARDDGLLAEFDRRLPYALTAGQEAVSAEIFADIARDRPMHRLLQGEVGSGKTVVALRAMLAVVDAGGQAALLAPTEVLAAQHYRSITALLGDLGMGGLLGGADVGTQVTVLTGSQSTGTRRKALLDAASGEAGIVIGTHALLQEHVEFADLALVVVDEQHRFGVEQRDALRDKGLRPPHLLVMTATPIPRTVAMTVFGDMEVSTLRELPKGRAPIRTHVVDANDPGHLYRTWDLVAKDCAAGHQVYVVCPRIGDDTSDAPSGAGSPGFAAWDEEADDDYIESAGSGGSGELGDFGVGEDEPAPKPRRPMTGVLEMRAALDDIQLLQGLRIEMLHGRMEADEKDRVMRAFAAGDIDVLVATTVIEVGVDVPNATTMVVIDADRFGISQLHQLRGRVGRGGLPGLCLLMSRDPGDAARERLEAVAATTDGFELAQVDLAARREGDVLGARQSGRASSVRFLRLGRKADEQIIAAAREDAFALVAEDPALREHPALAQRVKARLDEDQAAYLERG